MQAIREIVSRDIFKNYDIPKEFGDTFEMILVPINTIEVAENQQVLATDYQGVDEDKILMKYQSENGFSRNILAQESEDIWNDI